MSPAVTAEAHVCTVTTGTGELGVVAGAQTQHGLVGGVEAAGLRRKILSISGTKVLPWSRCRQSTGEVPAVELTRQFPHEPETEGI